MPRTVLQLQPKTAYDYGPSDFDASQMRTIAIAVDVFLAPWREAILIARVHEAPTWVSGSNFRYDLIPAAPCADDLETLFEDPTPNPFVRVFNGDVGSNTSYMKLSSFADGLGGYADLILTMQQGKPFPGTFRITISCDLILKA